MNHPKAVPLCFERFMRTLIDEAEKFKGAVSPNPVVGAMLIDKDGRLLAKGFHEKYGEEHAEVNCLKQIETVPPDAILIVNLEPCCHAGKTDPCTEYLIQKKVKNIVIGTIDPNPCVNGKSIELLKQSGINVTTGVLADECRFLNRVFFKNIAHKMPYVAVKFAMTFDGKTAMPDGSSKWITHEPARKKGHYYRSWYGATGVGKSTYLTDNPALDNRYWQDMPQPAGIIFWGSGLPVINDNFLRSALSRRIMVVDCTEPVLSDLEKRYTNIEFIRYPQTKTEISPVLTKFYEMGIDALLIEGGAGLFTSFFQEDRVDCIHAFIAPKLIAKTSASGIVHDIDKFTLQSPGRFKFRSPCLIGDDIEIIAERSAENENSGI